jgi:CubicO group peptidase (beta-lactamase class C family)
VTERDLEGVIERVDALVRQRMDEIGTPGLVLALTDRGGLLHAAASGHANADSREQMTTGHLLETGSIGTSLPVFHTLPRVVVEVAEVN